MIFQDLEPILEEILVECLVLSMICLYHRPVKAGNFLGLWWEIYLLACVESSALFGKTQDTTGLGPLYFIFTCEGSGS